MPNPPKKWKFILLELEIDGVCVETRTASHSTFNNMYKQLLREGQTQRLPWAIFMSLSNYKKPRVINSGIGQERDCKGRLLKEINHN